MKKRTYKIATATPLPLGPNKIYKKNAQDSNPRLTVPFNPLIMPDSDSAIPYTELNGLITITIPYTELNGLVTITIPYTELNSLITITIPYTKLNSLITITIPYTELNGL